MVPERCVKKPDLCGRTEFLKKRYEGCKKEQEWQLIWGTIFILGFVKNLNRSWQSNIFCIHSFHDVYSLITS